LGTVMLCWGRLETPGYKLQSVARRAERTEEGEALWIEMALDAP
jgi:hypothetical protein